MDDYNFNNQNGNDSDGRVNLEKTQNNNVNLNADLNSSPNQNPVQTTDVYNQNNGNMGGYNSNFGQPYRNENNILSIVSMVLGIVSILGFCCCTPIGILCGIGGVVTGIISKSKNMGNSGMALAGIITGAVGVVGSIVWMIVGRAFNEAFMEGFREGLESAVHFIFM